MHKLLKKNICKAFREGVMGKGGGGVGWRRGGDGEVGSGKGETGRGQRLAG